MAPGLRCTVCTHPERAAIDRALVAGEPMRRIATAHKLSEPSVRRHKATHLRRTVEIATRAARISEAKLGASTLDRAEDLYADLRERLELIAKGDDPKSAATLARSALVSLGLRAELLGEVNRGAKISVLVDTKGAPRPEWAAVQRLIGEALAELPEGPRALASAAIRRRFAAERAKVGAMTLEVDGGPALLEGGDT